MPFVQRNAQGAVIAMFRERTETAQEYLLPSDRAVQDFLPPDLEMMPDDPLIQRKHELSETDFTLIRAIEDMIRLLTDKGVLLQTELPPQLWSLIERRQALRRLVQELQAAGITDDL